MATSSTRLLSLTSASAARRATVVISCIAMQLALSASHVRFGARKQQEEKVGRTSTHLPQTLATQVVPHGAETHTKDKKMNYIYTTTKPRPF